MNPENKSQVCSDGASDLCCPGAAEHYGSSHTLGLSNRASKPLAYIHVIRFGMIWKSVEIFHREYIPNCHAVSL